MFQPRYAEDDRVGFAQVSDVNGHDFGMITDVDPGGEVFRDGGFRVAIGQLEGPRAQETLRGQIELSDDFIAVSKCEYSGTGVNQANGFEEGAQGAGARVREEGLNK